MKLKQFLTTAVLMLSMAAMPALAKGNGNSKGQRKWEGRTKSEQSRHARTERSRDARWRQMDTNHDGSVSRNEWRGKADRFNRLDRNHDGVINAADRTYGRSDRDDRRGTKQRTRNERRHSDHQGQQEGNHEHHDDRNDDDHDHND